MYFYIVIILHSKGWNDIVLISVPLSSIYYKNLITYSTSTFYGLYSLLCEFILVHDYIVLIPVSR